MSRLRAGPVLLALRALGLGDLLTALPALRALADAHPDHRRVLLAPPALAPVAAWSGAVDAVVPLEGKERSPAALPRDLPAPVDVAVNLHGRGPQSTRLLLSAGPRRLLAFAHPEVRATVGGPAWRDGEHEVARWCRLLVESGVPADPSRLDVTLPPEAVDPAARGATVVHPGAAAASRRWPPQRWAAVARREAEAGRRVLVTAGPGEEELAAAVATGARGGVRARNVASVPELAGVIAAAARVACGDTGVAHLATALGTPSVVLFGPVPPSRWGPPADRPQHRALWAGRTGDVAAPHVDAALLRIRVDDVVRALDALPR